MKTIFRFACILFLVALCAHAQSVITSTTLSAAVSSTATEWCVASATSILTPSLASNTSGSILLVDREAGQITGSGSSSTCFKVRRGSVGTSNAAHASGAVVWVVGAVVSSGDPSRPISASVFLGRATQLPEYVPSSVVQTLPTSVAAAAVTQAAGKFWYSSLDVLGSRIVKGACVLNGGTVGTDKYIFALWGPDGTLLANTALAGTATAGASVYQCIAFTAPVVVMGPTRYYIGIQTNGTTDNVSMYATGSAPTSYATGVKTGGSFGTMANISPNVTFNASQGPIMVTY